MSPTVAVRPMHPPAFETILEIEEPPSPLPNQFSNGEYEPISAHPPIIRAPKATASYRPPFPPAAYPMYPGLQTPTVDRRRTESMPMVLNRPRKLSNTSTRSSSSTIRSTESNASSWGSRTSYDSSPESWTPYQRPSTAGSTTSRRKKSLQPDELFGTLPDEVLEVVLECLQDIHLDAKSDSCATCWMRDLCSLSLSSKKWHKVAKVSL